MQEHWGKYDKMQLGVWEAIELLNEVVDDSDPDTALPQIEHLLQTAEACRKAFPEVRCAHRSTKTAPCSDAISMPCLLVAVCQQGQGIAGRHSFSSLIGIPCFMMYMPGHDQRSAAASQDDWMHLVGLLHDLGKVLAHPAFGSQPQWAVVGDTFPTGITPEPCVVYHELFDGNPDLQDPRFQGPCGAYSAGCGLDNVRMSWGHDEYGYRVRWDAPHMHNSCPERCLGRCTADDEIAAPCSTTLAACVMQLL